MGQRKVDRFYYELARWTYDPAVTVDFKEGVEGPNTVHIVGVGPFETLCGHCDRTDLVQIPTTDRPTCEACLEVWHYVKKGRL